MQRRTFLAAGLGALLPTAGRSQTRSVTDEIEERIPALMRENNVPGASIALVRDARLVWRREFGVADAASRAPVNGGTVFEAQSMSKPVFAYAVMKLKERGILDLDTPLTKYLPERVLADDPRLDLITARRVLSHTTGFQNWRTSEEPLKIHFTPGERWEYSGEGYWYLQSVVTRLAGRRDPHRCEVFGDGLEVCATDIDAYLKANILTPFGMSSSTYTWNSTLGPHFARPHDENGKPFDKPRRTDIGAARYASAGALMTTSTDYARFLIEVIAPKSADRYRLTPASLAEMIRPVVKVTDDPRHTSWALGWQVFDSGRGNIIAHGGDDTGAHCYCAAWPERRSAFVIMTNGEGGLKLLFNYMTVEPIVRLLEGRI